MSQAAESTHSLHGRRACIVRHSYFPDELSVRREADTLVRSGVDVSVICLRGEGQPRREVVDGVSVHRLPVGHRRGSLSRYLFEYNAFFVLASLLLAWLHLRRRFDVIQVNTMPDYLVFVALLPKLTGAGLVLHVHEPMPELFETLFGQGRYRPLIGVIGLVQRVSVGFADQVLTVTEEMRQRLIERGASSDKISVILNVPDNRRFDLSLFGEHAARATAIKSAEREVGILRVLTHGAIEERYGPDLIVDALEVLADQYPNLRFRLLGSGDYLDELLERARERRVSDRVDYLGFVPFDSMIEEILLADVTVVPVRANPYSVLVHTNKMYEYVALRRPVVMARLTSARQAFPEDALFYFEPGDAENLASAIADVLSDEERSASAAGRAARIYEVHGWSREQETLLDVHRSVLRKR